MKTTQYPHGTAFEHTFQVTARGEVEGQPMGWGDASHEKKWFEESLRDAVKDALARYYQCRLSGVSLDVTVSPARAALRS